MALVEYWVMRRPRNPFSHLTMYATDDTASQCLFYHNPTPPTTGAPFAYNNPLVVEPIKGQPWIIHSIHGSIQDAVASLKLSVSYIGDENTRIVKVINHRMELVLK